MTVTRTHRIPTELFGLSTDTKPTGEMIASTFRETNTRANFTWTGSAWVRSEPTVQIADSANLDAFARLRASEPMTIFDSKQIFDNQPLFWDESLESGADITSAHSVNEAQTTITSSLNTAGVFTRQTFMRFNYQPGKSQQIIMTGVMDRSGGGTGVQRRIGAFDDNNGLFFEDDEGTMKVVVRSKKTGSVVDTKVAQSSWNIDKMDGTGNSAINMDFTKSHIWLFDYEWLGVGRVRFGMFHNGEIIYVHQSLHDNSETTAYMSTPNLPLRYQMVTTGSSPASSMSAICATVISEGGQEDLGVLHHRSTAGTQIDMDTEDTLYGIVGLRLKAANFGATIKIVKLAVTLQSASDDVEWVLVFDPAVAGTPTWVNEANSSVQYFIGAAGNIVTGGVHIDAGYVSTSAGQSASGGTAEFIENALRLGAKIDGTAQFIVLSARPINGSDTDVLVEGGITWREMP